MFLQADFLLGDVEFFQVVDELLLEAVLIHLLDCCIGQHCAHTLLGGVDALGLVLRYLSQIVLYQVKVLDEVLFQYVPFEEARILKVADGFPDGICQAIPFLVAQCRIVVGGPDVGLLQHYAEQHLLVGSAAQVVGESHQLVVALACQLVVDVRCRRGAVLFADDKVHFASLQAVQHRAYFEFVLAEVGRQFDVGIELLAVEGLYLDGVFRFVQVVLPLGKASH